MLEIFRESASPHSQWLRQSLTAFRGSLLSLLDTKLQVIFNLYFSMLVCFSYIYPIVYFRNHLCLKST